MELVAADHYYFKLEVRLLQLLLTEERTLKTFIDSVEEIELELLDYGHSLHGECFIQLDEIDIGILSILQENCRVSLAKIGEQVGLSAPSIVERVKKFRPKVVKEAAELYENPLHPYTKALLAAVPIPDPAVEAKRERVILKGEVPSPLNPPAGCVFHPRCPIAVAECSQVVPELREVSANHWVACIRAEGYGSISD